MDRIRAPRLPPDHQLTRTVAQPRRTRIDLRDGLWLRLVDLPTALEAPVTPTSFSRGSRSRV